jgi:2,4-dienoyl-CoA reductase-like NADH-dependent reductase (Old Yellow Enzyme family)
MTNSDIKRVVEAFARATERSVEACFDVVEIHAAHGYLIHEFLSPLSNSRTDEYGGTFDNRIRFLLEVVEAVRAKLGPDKPLFLRISSTDWTVGGWTGDDSVELARRVKAAGVDLIDASSGGNVPRAQIPNKPGYQVEFAARIRREAGIATGAVGLITSAEQAEEILTKGEADLILMAREQLRDPYFPMHAAQKLGATVQAPRQYLRAFDGSKPRVGHRPVCGA